MASKFKQVDVFTSVPFKGNPVAVVMNGDKLSTAEMQQIAQWTNLSETTFVLPATTAKADYKLRIFTPGSELAFGGHPTIGSAHALLESGLVEAKNGLLVQECAAGLINITVKPDSIAFQLPEASFTVLSGSEVDNLESILGCPIDRSKVPTLVDVGARWVVASTIDGESVLAAKPNFAELAIHDTAHKATGVILYGEYSSDRIEVRAFAPSQGANEDPVCGSGNGAVAAVMRRNNGSKEGITTIKASQGSAIGRDGHLDLTIKNDSILVGGACVTCVEGTIKL